MTIKSMTGFSTQEVAFAGQVWVWELRSVNGRGLDLKIRLPEGADRFESAIRDKIGEVIRRGAVQVTLRRAGREAISSMPGPEQLDRLFAQIASVQQAALRAGVALDPVRATDILDGRLLPRGDGAPAMTGEQITALMPGLEAALNALLDMRQREGQTQLRLLTQLTNRIAELVGKARALERARGAARAEAFAAAMRRVLAQEAELDPGAAGAGTGGAGGQGRCGRGAQPARRPCRGRARLSQGQPPGGPQAGFPDAGIQPRGQYALCQGAVRRTDPGGA